ncbi:MerR family transcriptional regulator [Oceanirhabdus seepicola]|uniref:MerR family transcriptional regulator n=2 Tax=Oceanirhabdus seepicola TaxID=2828781 RepID=A0A9J6P0V6_9CLOT|nr:MerR family transcriptional regulator [Oceanirhabdus seepicola]
MKIGKFATENNISIDTIRYYMDLGLIMPEKIGGHYDFDNRCKKDLNDIFDLKEMSFTLNEIKSIFMFKKLGKLTAYQEIDYFKDFFNTKYKKVNQQIEDLLVIKSKLEHNVEYLSSKEYKDKFEIGIDIKVLDILKCLKCNKPLILFNGSISNNQILNGILRCECGEEYLIDDGILFVNNESNYNDDKFNYDVIGEYIIETDLDYLKNVYSNLEWIYKKLDFEKFENKVILDLGSGFGFFLRYIYSDLPDNSIYILVDDDVRKHRFLKNMLQKSDCQKKVIFICSDFLDIPIKDNSVDILIDYSGTSNYNFEHDNFLLKLVDNYVKDNAFLLGVYILFKKSSFNSFLNVKYKKNFILNNVKEEIEKLKYKGINERISNGLDKGGKYESYFKDGEKVYTYTIYGKR